MKTYILQKMCNTLFQWRYTLIKGCNIYFYLCYTLASVERETILLISAKEVY